MKKDCSINEAKSKVLISCAVTAQFICIIILAYANSRFSHYAAHIMIDIFYYKLLVKLLNGS